MEASEGVAVYSSPAGVMLGCLIIGVRHSDQVPDKE